MGKLCDPSNAAMTMVPRSLNEDARFGFNDVSLHCYIWTSNDSRTQRADLCVNCCRDVVLVPENPVHRLPVHVKRRILKFVSWGSWW